MIAAVRVEALKLVRSLVGMIAALALVLGTVALLSGITFGVAGGNPELIAQAGPAAELNWDGLLTGAAQITAIACILGFGIVLAWMFGREFTDGTITGLFALPVGRSRIALAKLIVYTVWAFVVGTAMALGVLLLGVLFGYEGAEHARVGRARSVVGIGDVLSGRRDSHCVDRHLDPLAPRRGRRHRGARGHYADRCAHGCRRVDASGSAGDLGHVPRHPGHCTSPRTHR